MGHASLKMKIAYLNTRRREGAWATVSGKGRELIAMEDQIIMKTSWRAPGGTCGYSNIKVNTPL